MAGAQSIVGSSAGRPINDFYPTPRSAITALLKRVEFGNNILEPACGRGDISRVLEEYGHKVISSDLFDYGYGEVGVDFLDRLDWSGDIITNPPFNLAEKFLQRALSLDYGKIAFLLKLAFLEGQSRSKLLERSPLKEVLVFRKRLSMTRNGKPPRGSGMIAFAWFIWEKNYSGKPVIGWL